MGCVVEQQGGDGHQKQKLFLMRQTPNTGTKSQLGSWGQFEQTGAWLTLLLVKTTLYIYISRNGRITDADISSSPTCIKPRLEISNLGGGTQPQKQPQQRQVHD